MCSVVTLGLHSVFGIPYRVEREGRPNEIVERINFGLVYIKKKKVALHSFLGAFRGTMYHMSIVLR